MTLIDEYWSLANQAIKDGLITKDQALLIARVGTRKEGYWARHIDDLKWFINFKRSL